MDPGILTVLHLEFLWANAQECWAMVAEACDPDLRKLYGEFAVQWQALAEFIERLEHDVPVD